MLFLELKQSIQLPCVFRTDPLQLIFDEDSVNIARVDYINGVLYFLIELDEYTF